MVDVKRVDVSNSQKDNFFQTSILKLKINYEKRSYLKINYEKRSYIRC